MQESQEEGGGTTGLLPGGGPPGYSQEGYDRATPSKNQNQVSVDFEHIVITVALMSILCNSITSTHQ